MPSSPAENDPLPAGGQPQSASEMQTAVPGPTGGHQRSGRLKKYTGRALLLVILYHLAGFLIVPYLLVTFTPLLFLGNPGLTGRLAGASFNPDTLHLELTGFQVYRRPTSSLPPQPYFGFGSLNCDLEWRSLRYLSLICRQVRLEHFDLRLGSNSAGTTGETGSHLLPGTGWQNWPGFSLHNLTIADGQVSWEDQGKTRHHLSRIFCRLPLLQRLSAGITLPPENNSPPPEFSALLDGESLHLKGTTGAAGQQGEHELSLDIQGLDLANRLDFLLPAGFHLVQGHTDLQLTLRLNGAGDNGLLLNLQGHADDLLFRDADQGTVLLPATNYALDLAPLDGSLRLRRLELERPQATIAAAGDRAQPAASGLTGILVNTLTHLLRPASHLTLAQLTVRDGDIRLATAAGANARTYSRLNLESARLSPGPLPAGSFNFSFVDPDGQRVSGRGQVGLTDNACSGSLTIEQPPRTWFLPLAEGDRALAISAGSIQALTGDFRLEPGVRPGSPIRYRLGNVSFKVVDLKLVFANHWQITVPTADLSGGRYFSAGGRWQFARLSGSGAEIRLMPRLFRPEAAGNMLATAPTIALDELELHESTVLLPNLPAATWHISRFELHAGGPDSGPGNGGRLEVTGRIGAGGQFSLDGRFSALPLAGDLAVNIQGLPLQDVRPLLQPFLPAILRSAVLQGHGRLAFPALRLTGDFGLTDLASQNSASTLLFRCPRATLGGLVLTTDPPALTARELRLQSPILRAERLARKQPALAGLLFPGAVGTSPPSPTIGFGKVAVTAGNLSLTDRTVEPPVEFVLSGITGRITGLKNRPGLSAPFTLQSNLRLGPAAAIDEGAATGSPGRLSVNGNAALYDQPFSVQGQVEAEAPLVSLGPWLETLLGAQPLHGDAAVSGPFTLSGLQFHGRQHLRITGLALDGASTGPFNTPLGLALLTDSAQHINLEITINGNDQPPYISFASGVAAAVRSRLDRTVAAPFSLLADLPPYRQDLDFIAFPPGGVDVPLAGESFKLKALAEILRLRPRLALNITGQADPLTDRAQNASGGDAGQAGTATAAAGQEAARNLQSLARQRADTVRQMFLKAGIEPDRVRLFTGVKGSLGEEVVLDRPGARVDLTPVVR